MIKTWKKRICLTLAAGLLLLLAACSGAQSKTDEPEGMPSTAVSEAVSEMPDSVSVPEEREETEETEAQSSGEEPAETGAVASRILVVYFSRTGEQYTVGVIDHGNTAIVAEIIAEETGADLFEVIPADDHYPMTYDELTDVAKQEQNENARPAYEGELPDLSRYDTVYIGAPVWWGDWPMIMYTFFEENAEALSGKELVPFSTHEGSGLSGFDVKLASAIPGSTVLDGLAVRGNDCQNSQDTVRESVKEWLAE